MGPGALALFAAMPLAAQDPTDRHQISAENNWSITDSDCAIDASWDSGEQILVTRHNDHHDFGVYNPHFKKVVNDKIVPVRFGAGDVAIQGRDYFALGRKDKDAISYVSDVDEGMLDQVAKANAFRFYRDDILLADLDMTGFAEALGAMRRCEAKNPVQPEDASMEAADAAAAAAIEPAKE